jgi:hypothetical protein
VGFPGLTSQEGDPNDSATFHGISQFLPGEDQIHSAGLLANPNRNMAFPGDAHMNDIGQSQQQLFYFGTSFDEPTLATYPVPWTFSATINNSQGSTSSADMHDGLNEWLVHSQEASPQISLEFQNIPNYHRGDLGVHDSSYPAPSCTEKPPLGDIPFIIEDPTRRSTYHEKRVRSREDLAKQKQDSHDLKVSGGACVWCYRSKKKCDASSVCHPCRTGKRRCIRDSAQLSLLALSMTIPSCASAKPRAPPFPETVAVLNYVGVEAFQRGEELTAVVYIRQHGVNIQPWAMKLTRADLTLPNTTKTAIDQLLARTIMCMQCPQLSILEDSYGSQSLVQKALEMAKVFLAISGLARTSVSTLRDDLQVTQLTILLVLVAGSQRLTEISECLSAGLHEALRRKDLPDNYNDGQYTNDSLHPLWVAFALYYRVISALLGLEPNSSIARIFKSLELQLEEAHKTAWSVIMSLSPCLQQLKRKPKQVLRRDIPELSSAFQFDLSVSTSWANESPFSESSYSVETLLQDPWKQRVPPTDNPLASDTGLRTSTEPQMERVMFGSTSSVERSESSSINPAVVNLLDPVVVPPGELSRTIETVLWEECETRR